MDLRGTGPNQEELSDRWEEALILKREVQTVWERLEHASGEGSSGRRDEDQGAVREELTFEKGLDSLMD